MRRLPPSKIDQNLSGLLNLAPSLTDELLQRVDQPLEVSSGSSRPYLLCDYNRDGDSYRSPWTNTYSPPLPDGFTPSGSLRKTEEDANGLFETFRELYYEGGISSVYLWDTDEDEGGGSEGGFAGCFLIKKDVEGASHVEKGSWNSIHVVSVAPKNKGDKEEFVYQITTTIMIVMDTNGKDSGKSNLAGSLTRQSSVTKKIGGKDKVTHLENLGRSIEDMEFEMRSNMDSLYLQKTSSVVGNVRSIQDNSLAQGSEHTKTLNSAVLTHGAGRKIDSES